MSDPDGFMDKLTRSLDQATKQLNRPPIQAVFTISSFIDGHNITAQSVTPDATIEVWKIFEERFKKYKDKKDESKT